MNETPVGRWIFESHWQRGSVAAWQCGSHPSGLYLAFQKSRVACGIKLFLALRRGAFWLSCVVISHCGDKFQNEKKGWRIPPGQCSTRFRMYISGLVPSTLRTVCNRIRYRAVFRTEHGFFRPPSSSVTLSRPTTSMASTASTHQKHTSEGNVKV